MALLRKVFVYGTLKRGQSNHHLLGKECVGKATFIGQGRTVEKYPLVISEKFTYPYLLDMEGLGKRIYGEIYEVDMEVFTKLDELEEYPDNYQRREIQIEMLNGSAPNITERQTDFPPTVMRCICYLKQNHQAWHPNFPHMESYDIKMVMDYLPSDDPRRNLGLETLISDPMVDYLSAQ